MKNGDQQNEQTNAHFFLFLALPSVYISTSFMLYLDETKQHYDPAVFVSMTFIPIKY